jgi:hypothetical protein
VVRLAREYILFGGIDPDNALRPSIRRMLPLDVLHALRDAENDLATPSFILELQRRLAAAESAQR